MHLKIRIPGKTAIMIRFKDMIITEEELHW